MKHLPSIEERVEEFGIDAEEKISVGLALTTDRHAIGEMLLEWVEKERRDEEHDIQTCEILNCDDCDILSTVSYNQALTDLQTFIKKELRKL